MVRPSRLHRPTGDAVGLDEEVDVLLLQGVDDGGAEFVREDCVWASAL